MALMLLLCCLQTACSSLSTTDLSAKDIELTRSKRVGNLRAEVDALARPMVETGYTPGLIVGVLLPDQSTHFFGYGEADKVSHARPTKDTLFAVGSLSKGFLAALVALSVEDGIFSWGDTLETLLPAGTALSADAKKITLLQLAMHTSGLPRQPFTFQTLRYFTAYLFNGKSFYNHFDKEYMYGYLSDFETGDAGRQQYSNVGYGLLSHILELHTKRSVDALLQEKVTRPLALSCTGYAPESLPCHTNRAYGYAGDQPKFIARGNPTPDWEFTNFMRGSAALHSTARDLLSFAAAHINGKQVKLYNVLSNNLHVRAAQSKGAPALAWVADTISDNIITFQIGIVAGYTSYIGIDTKHNTAVVIMQNSFNWDNNLGHKILLRLAHISDMKLASAF